MDDEYSIDYKAMYEELHEIFIKRLALENKRDDLLREVSKDVDYQTSVIANIDKMTLSDQVTILKAICFYIRLSKHFCEKYNNFNEEDADDLQTM